MINKTDIPYTYENSTNPWLMGSGKGIVIDGNSYTADYLWSLNCQERQDALEKVFSYYRAKGFPYEVLDENDVISKIKKLRKFDISKVITNEGYVSNSGNLCLDVCRYFCSDKFWKASDIKMMSIEDVFNNDDKLRAVLKNRMGWNTSTEDGTERPYMFTINDTTIRTGIRNSRQGYGVSNFRPTIAKYFYDKYLNSEGTILDYSAGWGARALAAIAGNYNYIGIDPLTSENCNNIITFCKNHDLYNGEAVVYNTGSENTEFIKEHIKEDSVDMCFSCPPYFNLEVYSNDESQSYNKFSDFNSWIEQYWKPTVQNCLYTLKQGGYFVLIIKDIVGKLSLKDEMVKVCEEEGLILKDIYQYKTSTDHMSSKKKTGKTTKTSEYILIFKA